MLPTVAGAGMCVRVYLMVLPTLKAHHYHNASASIVCIVLYLQVQVPSISLFWSYHADMKLYLLSLYRFRIDRYVETSTIQYNNWISLRLSWYKCINWRRFPRSVSTAGRTTGRRRRERLTHRLRRPAFSLQSPIHSTASSPISSDNTYFSCTWRVAVRSLHV